MTLETQSRNIRIVGGVVIAFGLAFVLAAWSPLNGLYTIFADIVIWPATDTHRPLSAEARLNMAIMGGVLAGLGAIWWAASGELLRAAPEATRKVLLTGAIVWFVTDSAGSVLAGAAGNVPPNIAFLILLLWPVWRPVKAA